MRYPLAGGAILAAMLLCATSAFAAGHVTIRYGGHVVLHGKVSAGTPVSLSASSSGKTVQGLLSTQATSIGTFHFEVAPATRTVYTAQTGEASMTVVVNVMPRIGLLRNGTVRVSAPFSLAGRTVQLQWLDGSTWRTFQTATIGGNLTGHFAHWSPTLTVRAFMPAVGHGLVAGTSKVYIANCGGCTLSLK
jgi:hypothetical protein